MQEKVRRLLKWGVIFSILWLGGIGSLVAIVCGAKARRLIKESGGQIRGTGGAWWCLIVGSLGLVIWLPILAVSVFNHA